MAALKNLDVVFSDRVLEQKTAELIRRYASQHGWVPSFPIPVDHLIEHTLDLSIDFDIIEEPSGTTIWGCIEPGRRLVTLNERHTDAFARCPGLERFTLGHEAGHWVMHVDQPTLLQASLFEPPRDVIVCRDGDESVHERVADRFSSFLLMPWDLMRQELPLHDVTSRAGFRALAEKINVSYRALDVRLSKMRIPHCV